MKAIAKTMLMTPVNQTPYSPVLVQHPFTSSGLVALPTEKYEGFRPIDITLNEENLKRWQESVSQIIDETENPYHIYMLLNPPYALTFLKLASPHLSGKDFSKILASAWINCEAHHNDPDLSKANLLSMFKSADPKVLMEDDEYEQLTRTVTSIVRVENRENTMVSVKTASPVPKENIFDVMELIRKTSVKAPVKIGDIILTNIYGTDIIATKDII